jgi:hypothetical protein
VYSHHIQFFGCIHTFSDIETPNLLAELYKLLPNSTSLDSNSKVLFSVVLKGMKCLHSLHGVRAVCTGLPPDEVILNDLASKNGPFA